jgi:hypothetical protein
MGFISKLTNNTSRRDWWHFEEMQKLSHKERENVRKLIVSWRGSSQLRVSKRFTYYSSEGRFRHEQLPPNLTHLVFDTQFNQRLPDVLPEGLTHLVFGDRFNQKLPKELPNGLTHLVFGQRFNQKLPDKLPESLLYFTVGDGFDQKLPTGKFHVKRECVPDVYPLDDFGGSDRDVVHT